MLDHHYEQLFPDLWRFANSIARHEHEAGDLIHDAWTRAMKHPHVFDLEVHQQRAWFFKTMKRLLIDERRKSQREDVFDYTIHDRIESPFSDYEKIEVMEILSTLPEEERTILFQKYWLGLSSAEIGRQHNMPPSTVRSKMKTALKQLQKY
ncbi:RNA polymerase sigma factor [Geomicrobium sp. JCM 19039]|uniref:RNA polymerase sigma factor n=1 Tax=Geomicrobium sp. JCM 19039 TaxID=1460636 RepID=UPI0005A6DB5F|nr:sigma-70 family RNA polymerase sigma factor [Geomicrobium sp. JCM 19039]